MNELMDMVIDEVKQADAEELFTGERFVPGIEDPNLEIEHFQRYLSVCKLVTGKKVLDAACGEGYGSKLLSEYAQSVIGIDIDCETIERAKKKYESVSNLRYQQGSVEKLEIEDHSIDVVISFETIEHVNSDIQKHFLHEIKRVLKTDGVLVMSTPNKAVYSDLHNYKNPFHVKEFYYDEFMDFLKGQFKNVKFYNQSFEVVSLLTRLSTEADIIPYYSKDDRKESEGKYFIAMASDAQIAELNMASVYFENTREYEKQIERILQLQEEEEKRNQHIHYLDGEIKEYQDQIQNLQQQAEGHAQELRNKEGHIEQLLEAERKYKADITGLHDTEREHLKLLEQSGENIRHLLDNESKYLQELEEYRLKETEYLNKELEYQKREAEFLDKEREFQKRETEYLNKKQEYEQKEEAFCQKEAEYRQTILNKEGHIEQLLEVEREYEREKKSRTYRMALGYRKISTFFLPVNSKRRFLLKVFVMGMRHPILMLRMIKQRKMKEFFTRSKTEGMESALKHYGQGKEMEGLYSNLTDAEQFKETQTNGEISDQKSISDYQELVFEEYEHPTVSIVIPVYNQFDYTYQCLASIKENSGDVSYEIIIADDCSTDLTQQILKIVSGIKVVRNKNNLRFLRNCNNAAKSAKGDYILFLNNDTQVRENWLKPLTDLMEKDPFIGMCGSKLIYADGLLQEAGGILWKDASAWNYGNRQNPNDSEFSYVREVDYISGAAIMIRQSLWKKIGGFDERFAPAYCEDSDLAFEVREKGYKVVYQPKSVVVHYEGISNGTDVTSGQKKYQVENQVKFYEKWKNVLEKDHFENGQDVFLARGRSKNKKHVLYVDHYVPTYDRDAGSKTTMMYLKMLVAKGYQITFWADNFYQEEPYTSELQQMGVMVLYGPKYAGNWKQWLIENLHYFDVIYLNRPHITIKYIDLIKNTPHKAKIIYYGHDLHFLRTHREYELTGDVNKLKESEEWKEQELYIMHQTDMNYYPSVLEEEAVHQIDPSIPVKAITAYVFEEFHEQPYEMDKRQGLLFVGGFGHGPNLDAVLWFLDQIFPKVYERIKAPFYIVGAKAPKEITEIKQEGVIVKGFVTEEELAVLYRSCRMVVVPLRYGAGVKGKVVEALYHGAPIVTTSVGAEGIEGVENIAVVKDEVNELVDAICNIYNDEKVLRNMSSQDLKYVKAHFSVEAVWDIVKNDFQYEQEQA